VDPIVTTVVISWLSVGLTITFAVLQRFRSDPVAILLASLLFLPSPLWIGDSLHKMIFASDLIAVGYLLRRFLHAEPIQWRPERILLWGDGLNVFFVFAIIPIVGTCLQIVFATSLQPVHTASTLLRMIFAVWIFANIARDVSLKIIDIGEVIIVASVAYCLYSFAVLLTLSGVIETDVLAIIGDSASFHEWNEGLGGGAMGLFRGEVGGVAAFASAVLIPFLLTTWRRTPIAAFVSISSFASAAYVGSRQGMAVIVLVLLLQTLCLAPLEGGDAARRSFSLMLITLCGVALVFSSVPGLSEWVTDRFELISSWDVGVAALSLRDERMWLVLANELTSFPSLMFGSGVGNVADWIQSDDWVMTYVDSDLLWGLQQLGIIGVALYLLLLIRAFWITLQYFDFLPSWHRLMLRSGLIVVYAFLYGHYALMNWTASHTAAATQMMALLAIIVGHRVYFYWASCNQVNPAMRTGYDSADKNGLSR
jgi:hypothetical protein